jgi:5-methylcytosine-specific restriction endonuclease McrA
VPAGRRCSRCVAASDKARGTAAARGYDAQWQRESKAFLARPENQRCACSCGKLADVVDHRTPHKGDMLLFWDRANWQPMNRACHSRKTAMEDGGFGRPMQRPA